MSMSQNALATAKSSIVKVSDGRGFVMKTHGERFVITAAHCLPHLPPPTPAPYTEERTYWQLLAPLDASAKPSIAAECIFADPVADLAVLAGPDSQAMPSAHDAYQDLVEGRSTLRLTAVTRRAAAWLLTLDGQWEECAVVGVGGRTLTLIGARIAGGMSGSPILAEDGRVAGVVSLGSSEVDETEDHEEREAHFQPALVSHLPGWLLAELFKPLKGWPNLISAQKRAWGRYLRGR